MYCLGEDLSLGVCQYLDAIDLMRLGCVSKSWKFVVKNEKLWKRLYFKRFRRRVEDNERFLGSGMFRIFRQECYAKAIGKIGKTVEMKGDCEKVIFLDERNIIQFCVNGDIKGISLCEEGKLKWKLNSLENAKQLALDNEMEKKRAELASAHKNNLFLLKINKNNTTKENDKFNLWEDDDNQDLFDEPIDCDDYYSNQSSSCSTSSESMSPIKKGIPIRNRRSPENDSNCNNDLVRSASFESSCSDDSSIGSSNGSDKNTKKKKKRNQHKHKHYKQKEEKNQRFIYSQQQQQQLQNCATLRLDENGGWQSIQLLKNGCQQNSLDVPRWSRDSNSPMICVSFTKQIHSCGIGGKYFPFIKNKSLSKNGIDRNNLENLSEDTVIFVTGHENGTVLVWGIENKFLGAIYTNRKSICCLTLLDNGYVVSGSSCGNIEIWEGPSSRRVCKMSESPLDSKIVKLEYINNLIVAGTKNGKVLFWETNGKLLYTFEPNVSENLQGINSMTCKSINQNDFLVACGLSTNVVIKRFNYQNKLLTEIGTKNLKGHARKIHHIHIDDHKVVTGSDDGTVKIWDLENQNENDAKLIRTIKWKKSKYPITSLLVGSAFIVTSRSDGSFGIFSYLSSWSHVPTISDDINDFVESDHNKTFQTKTSSGKKKKKAGVRKKSGSANKQRRGRAIHVKDQDLVFEDTFDEYDLQATYDYFNGYY